MLEALAWKWTRLFRGTEAEFALEASGFIFVPVEKIVVVLDDRSVINLRPLWRMGPRPGF